MFESKFTSESLKNHKATSDENWSHESCIFKDRFNVC